MRSRSISRRHRRRRGSASRAATVRCARPRGFPRAPRGAQPLYDAADASAPDLDGVVLAAAGIRFASHRTRAATRSWPMRASPSSTGSPRRCLPARRKTLAEAERLWRALRIDRSSRLVAVGGGTTTDLVGFVAATYMRGVDWVAVPSTLVGQVDASIGGKVGIDIAPREELVGAFHWPLATVIDTSLLETLPAEEQRNGLAEVVKTGLLAGEPLWEFDLAAQVRQCAAFQGRDLPARPTRARRASSSTSATPSPTRSRRRRRHVPHGRAVALGLLAALRLSGLDDEARTVEDVLAPTPVSVDRDRPGPRSSATRRRSTASCGSSCSSRPGQPRVTSEIEPDRVRAALDALIA